MNEKEIAELYKTSEDFKEYVDKYCACYKIDKEEAFKHQLLKGVATYTGH